MLVKKSSVERTRQRERDSRSRQSTLANTDHLVDDDVLSRAPGTFSSLRELRTRRVHFAHTDLSGLALFEEAFYHGVRAAEEILG